MHCTYFLFKLKPLSASVVINHINYCYIVYMYCRINFMSIMHS